MRNSHKQVSMTVSFSLEYLRARKIFKLMVPSSQRVTKGRTGFKVNLYYQTHVDNLTRETQLQINEI